MYFLLGFIACPNLKKREENTTVLQEADSMTSIATSRRQFYQSTKHVLI